MSWFLSTLAVAEEEREWVDGGFQHLERLGRDEILKAKMNQPTDYYFSDVYDRTSAAADRLIRRIRG